MLQTFLVLIGMVSSAAGDQPERDSPKWFLDNHAVRAGGCVSLVIDGSPTEIPRYQLRIGDREAARIIDLGATTRTEARTVILLSHDMRYVEPVGDSEDGTERVWIPPIFRDSGKVRLTIEMDGRVVGADYVDVVAAPKEVEAGMARLFPVVNRKDPLGQRERDSLWMKLIISDVFGMLPGPTPEQLSQLREELEILKKHPDWTEICEMRLASVEFQVYYHQLDEALEIVDKNSEELPNLPVMPEIVTRAQQAKLSSAFARALQDEIRSRIEGTKLLIRARLSLPFQPPGQPDK